MNEVRLTPAANPVVTRPASSKGGEMENPVQATGKALPLSVQEPAVPVAEPEMEADTSEHLQNAVVSINQFVQSLNRDLHFSVDEETERTVIKVIDGASGELIRQIPEEVFLELARKLNDDGELNLIDALG